MSELHKVIHHWSLIYIEMTTAIETLGSTLMICYSEGPYQNLMYEVEQNMKVNKEMRQKHEAIL